MSSKEKKFILFLIVLLAIVLVIAALEKGEKTTYAFEENVQKSNIYGTQDNGVQISSAEAPNLDEIIRKNSGQVGYKEEVSVKEEELEYITKYRNNPDIYVGKTQVAQEGRNGTQAITTKKIYDEKGKLIKEEQVSAVVVKASINKVIDIGTKPKPKPKPKTSTSIQNGSTSGNLSFNMALNKKSGLTIEQFTKALTDSKDKNKIFQNNAKYFYYAEQQYNINGLFVAAIGIHESAWGTSRIARDKNNLFGYGAYDSNPYNGAYTFEDYAESIDLVSRVLVKYYLNPKGTKIYDGGTANGKYYSGNTLSAVNKKYASDKHWAEGVYSHMQYLYSKIGK